MSYSYISPQFVEFAGCANIDDEEGIPEEYFECDHENMQNEANVSRYCTPMVAPEKSKALVIPSLQEKKTGASVNKIIPSKAKSDINGLNKEGNQKVNEMGNKPNKSNFTKLTKERLIELSKPKVDPSKKVVEEFKRPASARKTVIVSNLAAEMKRSLSCSKLPVTAHNIHELSKPKVPQVAKYVSDAEFVRNFHLRTPVRFRSRSQSCENVKQHTTVPHSPALQTKTRHRQLNVLSANEREIKEMEDMKKFRFKANPVNANVFKGPMKATVPMEKKSTVFKPFNLTEVPKRQVETPGKQIPTFHAKPVPPQTYVPSVKPVEHKPATVPVTPKVLKKSADKIKPKIEEPKKEKHPLGKTQLMPFSFDKRTEEMRARREYFVNKVLEDERKRREFKANPVPRAVLKTPEFPIRKAPSLDSLKPDMEFKLSTEIRAEERRRFRELQNENEIRLNAERKKREEELLKLEEEERRRLRRQTEFKSQPIRLYTGTIPKKNAITVTEPKTPKFLSRGRKIDENVNIEV